MKIKLDENMPRRLVEAITGMGHDVHTVPGEGLTGRDDETVWEAAQREGRFLVTQDMDFSRPLAASHHGVLLVRLRECGRAPCLPGCVISSPWKTRRGGVAAS